MTTARVSVTEQTRDELRDFTNGLNGDYHEAIKFLMKKLAGNGEDPMVLGRKFREEFQAMKERGEFEE